jgi:DNA replication factor GINS
MSTLESLDLKNLHVIVMQEFQTDEPRELSTDFFRNLSNFIGKLKNEEYDGIEKKTKNEIISTATKLTELLINKRLEKISMLSKISYSILTDEEKFVIDSNDEMNERKNMIISGIINGKSKFLEITSTKHKTKPVTVRFVKEFEEIVGVDLEKYGPFKPEDVATIPNENAQALISNGIVLKVRIEE